MAHYTRCPLLWQAVRAVWHTQLGIPQSILNRLGLCSGGPDEFPQSVALERAIIAFQTYNAQTKLPIFRRSLPNATEDSARAARA
eukprot:6402833-Pyramimonas_sp.AAC.1